MEIMKAKENQREETKTIVTGRGTNISGLCV